MNLYIQIQNHLNKHIYTYILLFVLLLSIVLRLININYNSPFNDEATYILIGKLGVFLGDWWTYNPGAWLAGSPYVYPVMTALASTYGGVIGSRVLNVIIGVLTVEGIFALTVLLSKKDYPENIIAGLIAAVVVGGSTLGLYISRLATYDTPSYYFFIISLVILLKAQFNETQNGKLYFFSSILLLLACLTKIIIVIYIPLVLVYGYIYAQKKGKESLRIWIWYFFLPLTVGMGLYLGSNLRGLETYAQVNVARDKIPLLEFFTNLWLDTKQLVFVYLLASIALIIKKRVSFWLIFNLLAFWVLIPHLISQRAIITLEKQMFLTIAFLSPIIGIGLSSLIFSVPKTWRYMVIIPVITLMINYCLYSYGDLKRFNEMWDNSNQAIAFLSGKLQNGDKVLAESGGTAILAGYNKNNPTNFSTFDWINYEGKSGEAAYNAAVKDAYFKYIELEGKGQQGTTIFSSLHSMVSQNLSGNYQKIYSQNGFVIYERLY